MQLNQHNTPGLSTSALAADGDCNSPLNTHGLSMTPLSADGE
jgi:hypothetical protein